MERRCGIGEALMQETHRKTCLLVFPDDWISYSPTVLNLLSLLNARGIETKVITFEADHPVDELTGRSALIGVHRRVKQVLSRFDMYSAYKLRRLIGQLWKEPRYDHYVGVDSVGALALQLAGIRGFDFLSLEVKRDVFFQRIDQSLIRYVLVQSIERYSYLFPSDGPAYFLIQNSPLMDSDAVPRTLQGNPKLVFLGNAIPSHGILECIAFIAATPDLTLEVCGLVPPNIAERISSSAAADRIRVRTQYVAQADIRQYLASFDIGICLYNVENSDFNYQSVPSGKLFNYFSVGLPVVATDLPGLRPVREFAAGVLLESNSASNIGRAVTQIRSAYSSCSKGAARAGNHFSFDRMARPYVEALV